jgi:hypothetical protein
MESYWRTLSAVEGLMVIGYLGQTHIRHPKSDIEHPTSTIPHPQSSIRNPQSDIRNPTSHLFCAKLNSNLFVLIHFHFQD